jgi:hypothetical protein
MSILCRRIRGILAEGSFKLKAFYEDLYVSTFRTTLVKFLNSIVRNKMNGYSLQQGYCLFGYYMQIQSYTTIVWQEIARLLVAVVVVVV